MRYVAAGEPAGAAWCCCRTCQRSVGAPSVAWASYAAGQLEVSGEPAWCRSSRRAERGFCARCGTSLFWRSADGRELEVTIASLDEPAQLRPDHTSQADARLPWAPLDPDLPTHAGAPPRSEGQPDAVATLDWLADLLAARAIPWRITGGLAARSYGAERPLADIDVEVPDEAIAALQPDVAAFVVDPPYRHRSGPWDLLLCTLNHRGQVVDLCGGSTCKIYDRRAGAWREDLFHPGEVELREVFGRRVPVVPRARLLAYKRALGREVDVLDVQMIEAADA